MHELTTFPFGNPVEKEGKLKKKLAKLNFFGTIPNFVFAHMQTPTSE